MIAICLLNDEFFVIFRRRDSAPVQPLPALSLHSINLPTSSNPQLTTTLSNFSIVDPVPSTKENTSVPASHTAYDVLPTSTADQQHSASSSSSLNDQQIIDIDTALREVLSGIQTVEECHAQCFRSSLQSDTDAPDLVLNLPITPPPSKPLPFVHSTIILDVNSSLPERNKLPPPPIMKKPQRTIQLIQRLAFQSHSISISRSSKATEV